MAVESYKSEMIIRSVQILDEFGKSCLAVKSEKDYVVVVTVQAVKPTKNVTVGWSVKTHDGTTVYGTSTSVQGFHHTFEAGEVKDTKFSLKPRFALGTYYLSGGVAETLTPEDEIMNYVMKDYAHDSLKFVVISNQTTGLATLPSSLLSFRTIEETRN